MRERFRYERERDALGRPANARPRDRYGRPLPRGAPDEMPDRAEPADVVESLTDAFERGAELFDAERFFEAHEFFEYLWHGDEAEGDAEFWKGVTQVAVGCCHTQRGNEAGAVTLLRRGVARLEGYPSPHRGVDTAALTSWARALAARVEAEGASPEADFRRFPRA